MASELKSTGLRVTGNVYSYVCPAGIGASTGSISITSGTYKDQDTGGGTTSLTLTCPTCSIGEFTQTGGIVLNSNGGGRGGAAIYCKVPASGRYLVWEGSINRRNTGSMFNPVYTWTGSATIGSTNAKVVSGGGTGFSDTNTSSNSEPTTRGAIVAYRVE